MGQTIRILVISLGISNLYFVSVLVIWLWVLLWAGSRRQGKLHNGLLQATPFQCTSPLINCRTNGAAWYSAVIQVKFAGNIKAKSEKQKREGSTGDCHFPIVRFAVDVAHIQHQAHGTCWSTPRNHHRNSAIKEIPLCDRVSALRFQYRV